jgi:hypothetical protein
MKIIEITETKIDKMAEYAEDALHAMGRLMSCISSLENGGYGERGRYGNHGGSMNYRDDEDWDSDDMIGERRGRRRLRDSRGRYM